MCSDWKRHDGDRELSLSEVGQILRNPLFDSVEKFVLSGGEPTLREDLTQIAGIVLDSLPRLQEMSLLTNGLDPTRVTESIKALLQLPKLGRLPRFAVSISLDGYGDTHEDIRRVPQAFERVNETVRRLKEVQRETPFYLSSTCVVQPLNIHDLLKISEYGQELDLPIIFSPVCNSDAFIDDADSRDKVKLTDDHLNEASILFDQMESRLMPSNLPFWREYFDIVARHKKRKLPCYLRHLCASLDSDGTLHMCHADSSLVYGSALDTPPDELWYSEGAKGLRKRAEESFCPRCTICCDLAFCFSHEFFYYSRFLLKERAKKMFRKKAN